MNVNDMLFIVSVSLLFSLLFTWLRERRFFVHHGFPDFIELLGYRIKFFMISFILLNSFIFLFIYLSIYFLILIILVIIFTVKCRDKLQFLYNFGISPITTPRLNKRYIVFSFDVEEDYDYANDCYINSYKYIDSGILEYIAKELNKYGIIATFYVTPNIARDKPEILRMLIEYGHEIGLHLHVHTLYKNIEYPYYIWNEKKQRNHPEDLIENYNYEEQKKIISKGKSVIENVLEQHIYLFRSGDYSCSLNTEKACKTCGFKAIANHRGVFYINPIGIWNLGRGEVQLCKSKVEDIIIQVEKKIKAQSVINAFTHPMWFYDYQTDEVKYTYLKALSDFLKWVKNRKDIYLISSLELIDILEKLRTG